MLEEFRLFAFLLEHDFFFLLLVLTDAITIRDLVKVELILSSWPRVYNWGLQVGEAINWLLLTLINLRWPSGPIFTARWRNTLIIVDQKLGSVLAVGIGFRLGLNAPLGDCATPFRGRYLHLEIGNHDLWLVEEQVTLGS